MLSPLPSWEKIPKISPLLLRLPTPKPFQNSGQATLRVEKVILVSKDLARAPVALNSQSLLGRKAWTGHSERFSPLALPKRRRLAGGRGGLTIPLEDVYNRLCLTTLPRGGKGADDPGKRFFKNPGIFFPGPDSLAPSLFFARQTRLPLSLRRPRRRHPLIADRNAVGDGHDPSPGSKQSQTRPQHRPACLQRIFKPDFGSLTRSCDRGEQAGNRAGARRQLRDYRTAPWPNRAAKRRRQGHDIHREFPLAGLGRGPAPIEKGPAKGHGSSREAGSDPKPGIRPKRSQIFSCPT